MEEFAHKMRGSLADAMPELVENVRRVADDEHAMPRANVLDKYGHLDDEKLDNWLRNFEPQQSEDEVVQEPTASLTPVETPEEEPKRLV